MLKIHFVGCFQLRANLVAVGVVLTGLRLLAAVCLIGLGSSDCCRREPHTGRTIDLWQLLIGLHHDEQAGLLLPFLMEFMGAFAMQSNKLSFIRRPLHKINDGTQQLSADMAPVQFVWLLFNAIKLWMESTILFKSEDIECICQVLDSFDAAQYYLTWRTPLFLQELGKYKLDESTALLLEGLR